MPIPQLPGEIQGLFEAAERTAAEYLRTGRVIEAERIYANQLAILRDLQRRTRKRFHKGGPLHNRGIAFLLLGQNAEATFFILLALVEDILSGETAPSWREAPAYRVLTQVLAIPPNLLAEIESVAQREREAGRIPSDPEGILFLVGIEAPPGFRFERRVTQLPEELLPLVPTKVDKWVFIGGSFRTIAILRYFRDVVKRRGYHPILLDIPLTPAQDAYMVSTAALDACDFAIFEVSVQEGQMIEIGHHYDRWIRSGMSDPRILILIQEIFDAQTPGTPRMIPPHYKRRCRRYRVLATATMRIRRFLP